MPSADPPTPRPIRAADEDALAAFLGSMWTDVAWRERFAVQWTHNPFAVDQPRGFLCETRGEITACFGSIPMPYRVPGRDVLGLSATALAVRSDQRGRGIARSLVATWMACPGAALWINATPNAPSARLFGQLGFRTPDDGRPARRVLLEQRPWSAAYRGFQERLGAAAILAPLGAPLVIVRARALGRRLRALGDAARRAESEQGLRVEHLRCDDARFDELWCMQRDAPSVQRRRDVASLRWTFESGPRAERNLLLGLTRDGALLAWIALREEPGRSRLRMVDGGGALDDADHFTVLAHAAHEELAQRRLDHLELRCEASQSPAFEALGLPSEPLGEEVLWWSRDATLPELALGSLDGDRILDVLL